MNAITHMERFTYPGTMQWPMTVEQQKANGLIASVNRSIHPKNWHKSSVRPRDNNK